MTTLDLDVLRDRLRAALPQLAIERVELEHADTHTRHAALSIETSDPAQAGSWVQRRTPTPIANRKLGHVYRMTVAVIDDHVNFFVHVHGESKDLTTQGAQCFSKAHADLDEVFAIVHSCWTGGTPS